MVDPKDNMDRANYRLSQDLDENSSSAVSKVTERADQMMSIIHQGMTLPERNGYSKPMIPDALKSAMTRGQTEIIQIELDSFKKSLVHVRNSELQALQVSCEQHIQRLKASNKLDAARMVKDKVAPFLKEIDRTFEDLIGFLDSKYTEAAKIQNPKAREIRMRSIEKQMEEYDESFNYLRNSVRSVISEIT
ncbi:hypothetical protein [Limnofasciculus baicalensis]|uniref:Uncharacterized protein n=1 Tax=Limnofasciculus baicalensis BBK-W-15 TaxID=2699891 RepID=A0AAE3GPJ3_9CYAN|nr:hypothetical protein [Limnofasciculus baicalensis]MCP2727626.1 hypothetical protein [Limnofasciculus baicalensis BBK-W-15]